MSPFEAILRRPVRVPLADLHADRAHSEVSDPSSPTPEFEATFVVEVPLLQAALSMRDQLRPGHLDRLRGLVEAGVVLEAGVFEDLSGSFLVLRAPSEAAVARIIAEDTYASAGLWGAPRVRRVRLSVGLGAQLLPRDAPRR